MFNFTSGTADGHLLDADAIYLQVKLAVKENNLFEWQTFPARYHPTSRSTHSAAFSERKGCFSYCIDWIAPSTHRLHLLLIESVRYVDWRVLWSFAKQLVVQKLMFCAVPICICSVCFVVWHSSTSDALARINLARLFSTWFYLLVSRKLFRRLKKFPQDEPCAGQWYFFGDTEDRIRKCVRWIKIKATLLYRNDACSYSSLTDFQDAVSEQVCTITGNRLNSSRSIHRSPRQPR